MIEKSTSEDTISSQKQKIKVTERFILQALRSTGYTPYSAIPELIDNGLDAEATKIKVTYDPALHFLEVEDNGNGMSYAKLKESMDIGCDREYDSSEIGYFGVGMKSACLNLVNLDNNRDNFIEIVTFDGIEATRASWSPLKHPLSYEIESLNPEGIAKGTYIRIYGVVKFQESKLKRDLGVLYYPILNDKNVSIMVNDSSITPNDPLYRESERTQHNTFYASVNGNTIQIDAVALDANQVKHSWDSDRNGRFSMDKAGAYVVYGGRYIEYGGVLGMKAQHNDDNRTRFEFTVPKELTSLFKVKFNKTKGMNIDDEELLSDLKLKIRDVLRWGIDIRKGASDISDDDKDKLDDMTKNINKSAKKARLQKPKKEVPDVKPDEPEPKPEPKPEVEKPEPPLKPQIRVQKIFDFKFEALDNFSVFWKLNWQNGVFVITINEGHLFYKEIFSRMDDEKKEQMLRFLASLAYAQYESLRQEEINERNVDLFWDEYWSNASTKLRYLLEN